MIKVEAQSEPERWERRQEVLETSGICSAKTIATAQAIGSGL